MPLPIRSYGVRDLKLAGVEKVRGRGPSPENRMSETRVPAVERFPCGYPGLDSQVSAAKPGNAEIATGLSELEVMSARKIGGGPGIPTRSGR